MYRTIFILIAVLSLFLIIGCEGNSDADKTDKFCDEGEEWVNDGCVPIDQSDSDTDDTDDTDDQADPTDPASITLTSNPTSINIFETSTITADVKDYNGDAVANGTLVTFEIQDEALGDIDATAMTNAGQATATFTASGTSGIAIITATSGVASDSINISTSYVATNIIFISAEPKSLDIKDSGGVDSSTITFKVVDDYNNPVSGVTVLLEMTGPNGGESIDVSEDGTPAEIDVVSDNNGLAQIVLESGSLAGVVTIDATIDVSGVDITVTSPKISIGGGLTSSSRFSVSADVYNLAGLYFENITTNISAYLSDRFGNFDVLVGTPVYFKTENGLTIASLAYTSETGIATVIARTQGSIVPSMDGPADVEPAAWELALQNYLSTDYSYDTTAHPRDGLCSILVHVDGEEHFDDSNANGIYDTGENFIDVPHDPYCDFNDNNTYDDFTSSDPEEYYLDTDESGTWDAVVNNTWDSNVTVSANLKFLLTGEPIFMSDTANFAVANGGSQDIKIIVCDRNLNQLPEGTTVTISTNNGTLTGLFKADVKSLEYEFKDSYITGPDMAGHLALIERIFTIQDDDENDIPESALIVITVNWQEMNYNWSIEGTIN